MLWQAGVFVAGNICCLLWPGAMPSGAGVLLLISAAILLWPARSRVLAFWLAGAGLAQLGLEAHRAGLQVEEERLVVEAEIIGLAQVDAAAARFDARLRVPREPGRPAQLARVAWPGPAGRVVRAGERWQLLLRLRPPRGGCNPGAVDTERNALRDHVQVFGTVVASPLNQRLAVAPPSLLSVRERVARRIVAQVRDPASGALLAALAVGATGDVSREQWRIFNATGITHLVAISGMHVTLFAVVAMAGVRRCWRMAARRGLRWRREPVAVLAGLLLATVYSLLAGFSVPTQRTLLMLASFMLLRNVARVARPSTSLGLAAVLVIVLDPFCTLSAGFWLSFLAVGAIIGLAGGRLLRETGLRAAVTVQGAVFVTLLPVMLAIFGSVSLAGLVVNLVAVPVFSFALVPLALGATAFCLLLPAPWEQPLVDLLLRLGEGVASTLAPWLSAAADQPQALWFAAPAPVWYLLAAVGVACVLPPWSWWLRAAGVCVMLPLLGAGEGPAAGQLRMTVLDVGAATAVLVETRQHALLYGLGEAFRGGGGTTERVVVPAVMARGLRRMDALVLPRLDRDAGEGVTALLARLPVARLFAAVDVAGDAAGAGGDSLPPDFAPCSAGNWEWEGWGFELLQVPGAGCVLRVAGEGGSLLLGERLDAGAEGWLLARGQGHADVLLAPRHMSPAASSSAFLDALRPRLVVASSRAAARDGAGYQEVAARYAQVQAPLLDTAVAGAVTVRLARGEDLAWNVCRDGRVGVWHAGGGAVR